LDRQLLDFVRFGAGSRSGAATPPRRIAGENGSLHRPDQAPPPWTMPDLSALRG
jgi:hypothetical protein